MDADDKATDQLEELRKEVEELRHQVREDRRIFDALPLMFWYKDTENRHLRVNKSAAALEGMPVTAIEGYTAEELYPPEVAEAFYRDDLQVIQSGQPKMGILEKHTTPLGKTMWLRTSKVPTRDVNGNVNGVIAVAMDITEHREMRDEMRDLLSELKALVDDDSTEPAALHAQIEKLEEKLDEME